MSENAWIFIANRENWVHCAEIGSFGLESAPGRLSKAQAGDSIVAYVKGESVFAGIGKLASSYYPSTEKDRKDGLYPHRVKFDIALDFDNGVDVRSLIDKLGFITDKSHWPVFFRGGVNRIPYSDFEIIKASIEKQKEKSRLLDDTTKAATSADETKAVPEIAGRTGIREKILSIPELTSSSLHDRLAEMIHVVGLRMGYDSVQRYKTIQDSPYQIDVVWLQNRNPQIAVEIHHGGVLGDALRRLSHARDFNFRKVILVVVEPEDYKRALDLLKFDEKLKHVIDLWSTRSVLDMYVSCISFYRLYNKFEESLYKQEPDTELT